MRYWETTKDLWRLPKEVQGYYRGWVEDGRVIVGVSDCDHSCCGRA